MINSYIKCPHVLKEAEYIPDESLSTFLQFLETNGYSLGTIHQYLGAVLHFSIWQRQKGETCINAIHADKKNFIDKHLVNCRCHHAFPRSKKSISAALSHWFRLVCHKNPSYRNEQDNVIRTFNLYLKDVAGLSSATRLYRCRYATEFLVWLSNKPSITLKKLKYEDLSLFINQRATGISLVTTASIAYSLNSFLRFLSTQGLTFMQPTLCVPHPKLQYRLPIKKSLSTTEVNKVFTAIDQSSPIGMRDYAVMRCLYDLGLRTSEVAGLKLGDIDWRHKILTLNCVKLRRQRKLPIPNTLFVALINYLTNARPKTKASSIFVYHRAPLGQSVAVSTIRGIARRAFARAQFPSSQSQVHRFRHTTATRLLINKVPLKTIADILGHQCINTTTRYTYINQKELVTIALPWPGGQDYELDIIS